MRTTVRLEPDLLRRAKHRALETGRTLNAVIEDALRAALAGPAQPGRVAEAPLDLPVSGVGGAGPRPGVDLDHSAGLWDVLDEAR
jgi:Ribbon-helix-helix protein, copG family